MVTRALGHATTPGPSTPGCSKNTCTSSPSTWYAVTCSSLTTRGSADGNSASVLAGLEAARERGLLTIALAGGDGGQIAAAKAADHLLLIPSADPRVVKELQVTAYHVLWELVHVFFEQPGVLGPGVVA